MLDGTIRFDGKALAAGELLFLSPLISQTMFVLINTMQQDMTQRLCWHCFLMTPHIVCALWFLLLFIVIWVYQKLHVRLPMSVIVYWLCTVFKTSLLASYASQIKGKFKKGKKKIASTGRYVRAQVFVPGCRGETKCSLRDICCSHVLLKKVLMNRGGRRGEARM